MNLVLDTATPPISASYPDQLPDVATMRDAILRKLNNHVAKRRVVATDRDWLVATALAVRDLAVDRSVLFENLKKVKAWVPMDGTYDLGSGLRQSALEQEEAYPLSRCISCCCCMEACPQFNEKTGFVGAATISQVRLFNSHPTGKGLKIERLQALMGDGGIQECGYAQNCVEVCPKDIPLTKSIADVGGQVMWQAVKDFFRT